MNEIFKDVLTVVDPVFMVGGSVRDILLSRKPKDYDFCTPLLPDEIEDRVRKAGRRPYLTGKKFGTIGFKSLGELVEVTTFRSETYIPGLRKPDVTYVQKLKDDLSRRDFTINAIAMDKDGSYIDPFGGRLDILAKKIRSVGEATDRFKEDPLRMLRAARFAAQLGFEVDPNMIGKIRKMAYTILWISRERWVQELDKLLISSVPIEGIEVMYQSYLLRYMLPELNKCLVDDPASLITVLWNIESASDNPDLRWAAFLLDIAKSFTNTKSDMGKIGNEMAVGICYRLRFSKERTKIVLESIQKQRVKETI